MTCNALCVRKDHSIEALAALLVTHRISGVPVIDDEGRPIGVVSKTDLVRERHENGDTVALDAAEGTSRIEDGFHELPISRGTVADVMTPVAITLHEHSSVSCAAALMAMEGLHRIVVVGEDDRVTGIVSALDIMRWLAVNDGYIRAPRAASAPLDGDAGD
jgi:CBS domain-containing protein